VRPSDGRTELRAGEVNRMLNYAIGVVVLIILVVILISII
jgi:hypothetical protein